MDLSSRHSVCWLRVVWCHVMATRRALVPKLVACYTAICAYRTVDYWARDHRVLAAYTRWIRSPLPSLASRQIHGASSSPREFGTKETRCEMGGCGVEYVGKPEFGPASGMVFSCGYDVSQVGLDVWPERSMHTFTYADKTTGPNDVMVYGKGGRCLGPVKYFRGKILYVNGEVAGDPVGDNGREFALGPSPKTPARQGLYNELQVYYASVQASRLGVLEEIQGRPALAAHNTGQHFLLYLSSRCFEHREAAFDSLSRLAVALGIERPQSGGTCMGQQGNQSQLLTFNGTEHSTRHNWMNNRRLYRRYRFSLTMENAKESGYVTEKILTGFLGGGIPIYYGTTEVFDLFNKEAFIYYDVDNPQPALDQIKHLETHPEAYKEMQLRPMLAPGALEAHFSWRADVGGGMLAQRIRELTFPPAVPVVRQVMGVVVASTACLVVCACLPRGASNNGVITFLRSVVATVVAAQAAFLLLVVMSVFWLD